MKQTVKTSRAAGQLEKMFRELNKHYFAGKLPEPIISLKKTPSAYGHITCSKVWQAGGENKYEINISSATLDRPIEETASTLLHEMVFLHVCLNQGVDIGVQAHPLLFGILLNLLLLTFTDNKVYPVVCFFVPLIFTRRARFAAHLKHHLSVYSYRYYIIFAFLSFAVHSCSSMQIA